MFVNFEELEKFTEIQTSTRKEGLRATFSLCPGTMLIGFKYRTCVAHSAVMFLQRGAVGGPSALLSTGAY